VASPPVVPSSDDKCEFGEGRREPMPGIDVGGKFVVVTTGLRRRSSLCEWNLPPPGTLADTSSAKRRRGIDTDGAVDE
jgi:hypothetical protein